MDTELIALNPGEMMLAQNALTNWCVNKIAEVKNELASAQEVLNSLVTAGMHDLKQRHVIKGVTRRITFYEKIKAALDAGYYIVPPFPVQSFAIRSNKAKPPPVQSLHSTRSGWDHDVINNPPALPNGVGEFHNIITDREYSHSDMNGKNADGTDKYVDYYSNVDWKDVEFPMQVTRPELIEATSKAMKEKIFDRLGVLPTYRKDDPIIVGQIKHWQTGRSPVTFFVAWWLNTAYL